MQKLPRRRLMLQPSPQKRRRPRPTRRLRRRSRPEKSSLMRPSLLLRRRLRRIRLRKKRDGERWRTIRSLPPLLSRLPSRLLRLKKLP